MTFLKVLMLIRQANQKTSLFVIIGIFLDKGFKIQPDIYNGCHDVLMMSMNLKDTAVLIIAVLIIESASEALNLLQNAL